MDRPKESDEPDGPTGFLRTESGLRSVKEDGNKNPKNPGSQTDRVFRAQTLAFRWRRSDPCHGEPKDS